jgi:hypothetical protein
MRVLRKPSATKEDAMQPSTLMTERPGDRYWRLICKLRWIGMDDDAAKIQAKLQLLPNEKRGTVFAEPPDTD